MYNEKVYVRLDRALYGTIEAIKVGPRTWWILGLEPILFDDIMWVSVR